MEKQTAKLGWENKTPTDLYTGFLVAELKHNWVRILVLELIYSQRGFSQCSSLYVIYIQMLLK